MIFSNHIHFSQKNMMGEGTGGGGREFLPRFREENRNFKFHTRTIGRQNLVSLSR